MKTHKHARLTFARRIEMVKQMTLEGVDAVRAAAAHGVRSRSGPGRPRQVLLHAPGPTLPDPEKFE